jgi:hypothetical protein
MFQAIDRVEKIGGTPSQQLLHLLEIAAKDDNRLEKAMRIWAIRLRQYDRNGATTRDKAKISQYFGIYHSIGN